MPKVVLHGHDLILVAAYALPTTLVLIFADKLFAHPDTWLNMWRRVGIGLTPILILTMLLWLARK